MNIETFGIQSIASSTASQPVFGTTLSAASTIQPDRFSGSTGPIAQPSMSYLTFTSVVGFKKGQRIAVAPKFNFTKFPSWGIQDCGLIFAINGNVVQVEGLTMPHASGEYVLLTEDCSEVWIIPVVPNAIMYVGNYATLTPTTDVMDIIPAYASGAPSYIHQSREGTGANTYKTSEYWIYGTANDKFVARYTQT